MSILVNVVNQKMYISSTMEGIVAGSQNFVKFRFNLTEEWDGLMTFAQFKQRGVAYNQYLDEENSVFLPPEIGEGTCTLMLYGTHNTTIATTNYLTLKIDSNILVSDATSTEISQTLYDQLVSRINALTQSGVYVGSEEPTDPDVDVWIDPDDEENVRYIPVPDNVSAGQTVCVSAVNDSGVPTEWEAIDIPSKPADVGAIPAPAAAVVGQHFVVSAVDENGMVTAVEAVDMPSGGEYALPLATADALGGVKAEPATEGDTQPVRISEDGMLFTAPGGGGGEKWEKITDVTVEMDLESIQITEDQNGKPFSLKKVFILIEAHPALQEGSSQTLIGLNFTTAHAWSASFARFRGPANENEWGLRQLVVSVAEDGLLIPINALASYNDTNMKTQLLGLKDDKNFIDYTTATAGRTYVSTETWIDIIQLGSYTQGIGKGTRLIVYGVRA